MCACVHVFFECVPVYACSSVVKGPQSLSMTERTEYGKGCEKAAADC